MCFLGMYGQELFVFLVRIERSLVFMGDGSEKQVWDKISDLLRD